MLLVSGVTLGLKLEFALYIKITLSGKVYF